MHLFIKNIYITKAVVIEISGNIKYCWVLPFIVNTLKLYLYFEVLGPFFLILYAQLIS